MRASVAISSAARSSLVSRRSPWCVVRDCIPCPMPGTLHTRFRSATSTERPRRSECRPRRLAALGVLATLAALATTGCGSTPSHGTGLAAGTVDNHVAKTLHTGMPWGRVTRGLNGGPIDSTPFVSLTGTSKAQFEATGGVVGRCVAYRGVDVNASSGVRVTGTVWHLCRRGGRLAVIRPACPIPWKPSEFGRYRHAGYAADPSDCRR